MKIEELEEWQGILLFSDEDVYHKFTHAFAEKNDLDWRDVDDHMKVVREEFRELEQAIDSQRIEYGLHNKPGPELEGEMVDLMFTVFLLAKMMRCNIREPFINKSLYNLEKSGKRNKEGKIIDDV